MYGPYRQQCDTVLVGCGDHRIEYLLDEPRAEHLSLDDGQNGVICLVDGKGHLIGTDSRSLATSSATDVGVCIERPVAGFHRLEATTTGAPQ
jgi:hypothetical protein